MRNHLMLSLALASVLMAALMGGYGYGVWRGWVMYSVLAVGYAVMSLIAVAAFFSDKAASAREASWRVPEAVLHGLELLGGWPGSLLAQICFWHKLNKMRYQLVFWLIVALHGAAFYYDVTGGVAELATNNPVTRLKVLFPKWEGWYDSFFTGAFFKRKALFAREETAKKPAEAEAEAAPAVPPVPEPSLEEQWAADAVTAAAAATEPVLGEPSARRSLRKVGKQSRTYKAEVKAVSPSRGLLLSMPEAVGGEGVVAPATLVPDFHRRFRVGERVTVAVQGVSMKGQQKRFDLVLIDP